MAKAVRGNCPLEPVERRHADALASWVECKRDYCDPVAFRRNLNNCIQALRSVTFVLQKQKGEFSTFSDWYASWQARMRRDRVLKWSVQARNRVVKEGDLQTHSRARVAVVDSWFEPPEVEFDVPPLTPTEEVAAVVMSTKPKDYPLSEGMLRVERRWVVQDLADWELLEALSHVFGVLAALLLDAHRQLLSAEDRSTCGWFHDLQAVGGKLPPCMVAQEWDRAVWVDLADGLPMKPVQVEMQPLPERMSQVVQRYPDAVPLQQELMRTKSLHGRVDILFAHAQVLLSKDGHHEAIAFVGYPDGTVRVHQLALVNRSAKQLLLRQLATGMAKTGANSVIIIAELWVARFRADVGYRAPAEDPDRREALQVLGAQADGKVYVRETLFHKNPDGKVVFDEEEETDADKDALNFLEPFRRVWGCTWVRIPRTTRS